MKISMRISFKNFQIVPKSTKEPTFGSLSIVKLIVEFIAELPADDS